MKHPKQEKTVLIVKPDGVKRGLMGEVISRIESRGLKIIALEMVQVSKREADTHYPKDKEWIEGLGKNTLKTYDKYGHSPKKELGTDSALAIGRMVRAWLIEYFVSGPVVKMVIEGVHAIDMTRKIVGPTIPSFAEMGTIRGDFSVDSPVSANFEKRSVHNLVHASGNPEESRHEIGHWFKKSQIHSYNRSEENLMF